jgi:hypothetical protein
MLGYAGLHTRQQIGGCLGRVAEDIANDVKRLLHMS